MWRGKNSNESGDVVGGGQRTVLQKCPRCQSGIHQLKRRRFTDKWKIFFLFSFSHNPGGGASPDVLRAERHKVDPKGAAFVGHLHWFEHGPVGKKMDEEASL